MMINLSESMKKKEILKEEYKKNAPARDVGEYLATVPEKARPALENLRNMIKSTAPMAEEIISYHIPTYKYHGPLVHFVAR